MYNDLMTLKAKSPIIILVFVCFINQTILPIDLPEQNYFFSANKISRYTHQITINEMSINNRSLLEDEDGDYSQWVELHNISNESIDLKGWYLSNDRTNLSMWMFSAPYVLEPNAFMLVYLSGKDKRTQNTGIYFHTNFTISDNSNTVFLVSPDRVIQDSLETKALDTDRSIGRVGEGLNIWTLYNQPTPGNPNTNVVPAPALSHSSGFYPDESLLITAKIPFGYELRYTINDHVSSEDDKLAATQHWVYPSNKSGLLYDENEGIQINENSVIKARLYNGNASGPEKVFTYFIDESIDIPVISLTTDPANLWDPEMGIYVEGIDPDFPNYLQENWERPARFTYFSSSSQTEPDIDLDCLIRVFGSSTRKASNKTLAVFTREREMPNYFFGNNSGTVYSLLLRTSASDFNRALMRDIITSELIQPLDIDSQDFQQAVLFLNGEFWGIVNIREKINEEMLEDKYQIPADELDLVFGTLSYDLRNGTIDAYEEMINYITTANLNLDRYYDMVGSMIDIDNFIDYVIVETFINNGDWPENNVKAYRPWENNGLWRWIVYDTDASYDTIEYWSRYNPYDNHVEGRSDFDSINRLLRFNSSAHIVRLFQSLMMNERFKNQFVKRYEELLGAEDGEIVNEEALLGSKRLLSIIESLSANIEPLVQRHIDKWIQSRKTYMHADSVDNEDTSINRWYAQIDILRDFARERPGFVADFIEKLKREYTPVGKNIITNGDFKLYDQDWNLNWSKDYSSQRIGLSGDNEFGVIEIFDDYEKGSNPSSLVAMVHDDIILDYESIYEFSFRVKTEYPLNSNETMLAYLFKSSPGYTQYSQIEISPSTEWESVKTIFTMLSETDNNARLQFRLGKLPAGTVIYLDDIRILELE
jgi:hypothetical protein